MSGRDLFCQPRRIRRGAALTLVFASVLVAGAATGSLPSRRRDRKSASGAARSAAPPAHHEDVAKAAAEAMADGKSPMEAAERAVSRSGDRWGAVYSQGEYEEFEEALDGQYTGVGLWARRERDGRIEVTKVAVRLARGRRRASTAGDRLRSVDGERVDGRPVTEVVSLLRGDATDAAAGTAVAPRPGARHARVERDAAPGPALHGLRHRPQARRRSHRHQGRRVHQGRPATWCAPPCGGPRPAPGSSSTCAATPAAWSPRPSPPPPPSSTAASSPRTTSTASSRPCTPIAGGDTTRPLVALVDGGTMSAAELLTGALQDRGRAVVVGSRTFGKGSVQMPSRLPDGSVAELTVGHYRTPSGRSVDGRGITPDLDVTGRAAALQRAETVLSGLGDAD